MTLLEETTQQNILTEAHHDYQKVLYTHAQFKIHDTVMSEDLVQDTFIKTWSYLVRGGKIDTMKAFLYHVLNNLIIDEYRKRKTTSLDVLLENGYEPSVDESERTINKLDGKALVTLIDLLPKKYKKVMRMRYIQLLTLAEIALLTGQTKNTIAVQTYRGLGKLRLIQSNT
jgi:RNA polymerase sigma-70 factor (ECF subfamily)